MRRCGRTCSAPLRWNSTGRPLRPCTLWAMIAPPRGCWQASVNEAVLLEVRNIVADAVKASRRITPAGEWLLDNFYLIEEQIRAAKRLLPEGYAKGSPPQRRPVQGASPRVRHRPGDGFPRRWPGGPGESRKLRCGLSDGCHAAAGRTMGNSHHAPSGIDRESQAGCPADRH